MPLTHVMNYSASNPAHQYLTIHYILVKDGSDTVAGAVAQLNVWLKQDRRPRPMTPRNSDKRWRAVAP